jgi:hypothetical protein
MSRRYRTIPIAAAMVLTVAAGLSIAEEHARRHATDATAPAAPSAGHLRAVHLENARSGAPDAASRPPITNAGAHPSIGVGSRALTGDDAAERGADPERE